MNTMTSTVQKNRLEPLLRLLLEMREERAAAIKTFRSYGALCDRIGQVVDKDKRMKRGDKKVVRIGGHKLTIRRPLGGFSFYRDYVAEID